MAYPGSPAARLSDSAGGTLPLLAYLALATMLMVADQRGGFGAQARQTLSVLAEPVWWLAAAPGRLFESAGDLAANDAKYDAVGTLKPVVSKRAQAPRFALVDDHGDVVTFVTASPDVNLQSYVGKRIGVLGNRGFMPEYRRAHVTASRVTPLEERLVR